MVSPLVRRQWQFAALMGQLLCWGTSHGIHVTWGEGWRPEITAIYYAKRMLGIRNSLHRDRLAQDLNVFSDAGEYMTDLESYRALGEYWESLGGAWGGRFGDPGHFSLEWQGRK